MWYWLRKFEGVVFIPLFVAWYALRGVPFFTRCQKCGRWLFDQLYLRSGMCEKCTRAMATCEPREFYQRIPAELRSVSPAQSHHDRRTAKQVGCGKVLDVGCGSGRVLSILGGGRELYGIDMAIAAVNAAKIRLKEANFFAADATAIPFKFNTFDYVICTEVLEHIQGNDVIRECHRVLKPKGIALMAIPNGKGPSGRYFPYHIRLFSLSSIIGAIEEAGFEIILAQKFGLYIPFLTRLLEMASSALDRNLPFSPILNVKVPEFLADHFLIACRKLPI